MLCSGIDSVVPGMVCDPFRFCCCSNLHIHVQVTKDSIKSKGAERMVRVLQLSSKTDLCNDLLAHQMLAKWLQAFKCGAQGVSVCEQLQPTARPRVLGYQKVCRCRAFCCTVQVDCNAKLFQ